MQGNRYTLRDRRKLIAFQDYLESTYPLYSYDVADIGDYVRVHFTHPSERKRPRKENLRVWKSTLRAK
jgi:hypothetical protein